MSGAEPTDDQLVAILKHVAMLLSPLLAGMDQMRQQLEAQVLRSLLFARLRLRHVCCPVARITCVEVLNSRNIDPDTWQPQDEQIKLEILEEDESIRKDFEVLLADIYDNMQKSGKKFEEWFMANFESRARLSIVALDPVDAEYVKTVQHLGVRVQPHGHSI
ncbi:hypothetical protein HII31_07751 [Pseudocercospora fuligena]|uniref:Uncharacterized protein n=1 Tax=Pseudocercospora fuligena TaxID=685502 RepID=A0A8H6RH10_9PEZI|nr:hypothetical protein HII31_07751 [Pseudocercospora fuligena]